MVRHPISHCDICKSCSGPGNLLTVVLSGGIFNPRHLTVNSKYTQVVLGETSLLGLFLRSQSAFSRLDVGDIWKGFSKSFMHRGTVTLHGGPWWGYGAIEVLLMEASRCDCATLYRKDVG